MIAKQNHSNYRKDGAVTRSDRTTVNQQVESMLKEMKERTGDVILVQITPRTTIELPAHLSQEEREARVNNYIKVRHEVA